MWKSNALCVRRGITPAWTDVTSRGKKTCNRYVFHLFGVPRNCRGFLVISSCTIPFRSALPCLHMCKSLSSAEPAGVRPGSHLSCIQGQLLPAGSWPRHIHLAQVPGWLRRVCRNRVDVNRFPGWETLYTGFPTRQDYSANSTFPRIKWADKRMLFSPAPSQPAMLRSTSRHLTFLTYSLFIHRCWDAILRSG